MDYKGVWGKLGNFLRWEHRQEGRGSVVRFVYEKGWVEYDGREWTWGERTKVELKGE